MHTVPKSAMEVLRSATSDLHRRIESNRAIGLKFESLNGLGQLLGRWYGFFVPFEREVGRVSGAIKLDLVERSKLSLLQADLHDHGIPSDELPLCNGIPVYETPAQAIGAMYVTEGSTLGGQWLARRIESQYGLRNGAGYSFFAGYREQTSRRWKEFTKTVEETCSDDPYTAADSAVATFECIERWLIG